ncbi:MAG: hypothetical protein FJZ97_11020 [Chloroflexi bacterium]|nr:hypothetical protein [Chloroflexota bacterium]
MLNLTRQPRSDGLPGEELVLRFDHPEARGTLILRECAYGLEIVAPDLHPDPLAVLDLYYAAAAHLDARARSGDTEPDPLCQIIIHTPAQTEDALGRVRFFADHTEVDLDPGVTEWQSGAEASGSAYGYPLTDYPPVALAAHAHGVTVFHTYAEDQAPSPHWYTTDPTDAGPLAGGHQFDIRDVILALGVLGRRMPAPEVVLSDPARLRETLVGAIAAGIITRDGIVDWQSWPRCASCDALIPPDEHSHACIACGATLCNHCFSARARCPRC